MLAYPAPQVRTTNRRRPEGDNGPWRRGLCSSTLTTAANSWSGGTSPFSSGPVSSSATPEPFR